MFPVPLQYSTQPKAKTLHINIALGSHDTGAKYTFIECTGAKVETKVRLSTQYFTPLHKLIGAKLIGLGSKPSKLWPSIECQRDSFAFDASYLAGL